MTKLNLYDTILLDTNECFLFGNFESWWKMKKFFTDVKNELKKVRWLDKKEMTKYSIATIAFILIFSIFFGGLDLILAGIKSVIK